MIMTHKGLIKDFPSKQYHICNMDAAFASRKQPAILRDDEVGGRLPGNKSEEGLSDLECDSENELDDCAVLDVEVDGDSDQDDIKDFVWEDMNNYKGKEVISCHSEFSYLKDYL
jgi:hypothetical protein